MGASDAQEAHLNGRDVGYVFQGRDSGHISTRQIQRLLDTVAERAGLQQTRQGNVRQRRNFNLPSSSVIIYTKKDEILSMSDKEYPEIKSVYYLRKIFLIISMVLINFTICAYGATLTVNSLNGFDDIQEAINSASEGDEILVYPGTYYENIVVDKHLALIGLKNPVIDAGGDYAKGPGVTILADGVLMEGFTIRNSTNTAGDPLSGAGVLVRSNNNTIKGNILENNYRSGIKVLSGCNNSITNNSINYNFEGILISDSRRNKILKNYISNNNGTGIYIMHYSEQNLVIDNIINNNSQGVLLIDAGSNEINENTFFGNRNREKNIEIFHANF
jgi:parallel beta-helix repeat protein